jgi:hypothetical protein
MPEEELAGMQEEEHVIKTPKWSLDVKILNGTIDLMEQAKQYSLAVNQGDGRYIMPFRQQLMEVFDSLGGSMEGDGNMLNEDVRNSLGKCFDILKEWDMKGIMDGVDKGQMNPASYEQLKEVLRLAKNLLQGEINRLFVKFTKFMSPDEMFERHAMGRSPVR